MIRDVQEVYGWLNDSESKGIFLNRLNYTVTRDFRYIINIVDEYSREVTNGFSWKELICSMKKLSDDTKIIICGAGVGGVALYSIFKTFGINVDAFCDRNESLVSEREIKVIGYETLFNRYKEGEKIAIVIGTRVYFDEIYKNLILNGIKEKDIYKGSTNIKNQYFDMNLLNLSNKEFFVDCGALDLEISRNFLKVCPEGKAYAFEPDEYNYNKCLQIKAEKNLKSIEVYKYGCGAKDEILRFLSMQDSSSAVDCNGNTEISVTSLDKILNDKQVTFIKMDIEGMELEALKGASKIIKEQRPKMAISIYHKDEDLITIPTFIKSLVPEYKLYLRHYNIYQEDTILYAVI